MSQVQSGILPEHCRAAIWIEANVKGDVEALRAAGKAFVDKLATFQAKFPEAHLGAVVAFGNCASAPSDDGVAVACKAQGSQHISYVFTGTWSGPEGLMPSDDTLKSWKVSKILWKQ